MSFKTDQDKIFKNALKGMTDTEKRVAIAYRDSLKNVRNELIKLSEKVDTLTYAEMTKFNRLRNLEQNITKELKALNIETTKIINNDLIKQWDDTYFQTWYGFEKEVGLSMNFGLLDQDAVKAAVQFPWGGSPLNQVISDNTITLLKKVNKNIVAGIIEGKSLQAVSREISKEFDTGYKKALTIVRTETLRAYEQSHTAARDKAINKGVEVQKVWMATIDGRVRDGHIRADGQRRDPDKDFNLTNPTASGPAPHMIGVAAHDINCRCRTVDEIVGLSDQLQKRRVRDVGVVDLPNMEGAAFELWKKMKLNKKKNKKK